MIVPDEVSRELDRWAAELVTAMVEELERVTPEMRATWRAMDAARAEHLLTRWRQLVVLHVRRAVWARLEGR